MRFVTAVVLMIAMTIVAAPAAPAAPVEGTLVIQLNHGRLLAVSPVSRVVVAAPEIADVNVITRTEIMVIAKRVGETTLSVWNGKLVATYRVLVVSASPADVGEVLTEVLGSSNIRVRIVEDTVMLEGVVKTDADKARAESIASAFGKRVINLLTPEAPPTSSAGALEERLRDALKEYPVTIAASNPDTVRIEGVVPTQYDLAKIDTIAKQYAKNVVLLLRVHAPVQVQIATVVAEINTTALNQLGIQWGGGPGSATDGVTFLTTPYMFNFGLPPAGGNLALQILTARLQLLQQRNAAKVLSNPRLTVLEGHTSKLLVGGELPIPTVGSNGQVNVTFKEFGIRLEFKPVVQPDTPITLDLLTEVSSLNFTNAIVASGFTIPTIDSRRVETVVSLRPGEYLAIGGLIQHTESKVVQKIPLLGDIPIIGALFRSTNFQRGESELVIFVTPSIVTPVPAQPQLPPGPNPDAINP